MNLRVTGRRLFGAVVLAVGLAVTAAPGQAQTTYTWNNFAGTANGGTTNWSDTANWVSPPTFDQNAVLSFGASPLQAASSYTAAADQAVNLNGLAFAYTSGTQFTTPYGGASNLINLGAGSTASVVRLNPTAAGAAPSITQNGSGSVSVVAAVAGSALTIEGNQPLTIGGTGIGAVDITAPVQAGLSLGTTPGLLINFDPSTIRTINSGGTVNLAGTNTFNGNVVLQNGNLGIANNTALGAATNQLIINPGQNSVRANFTTSFGSPTIPNPVVLNANMNLVSFENITSTWTGAWSGSGGLIARPSVGTTVNIFGPTGFTGPLVLRSLQQGYSGTANDLVFNVGSSTGGATTGSLATADIQLFPGTRFVATNANATATRLNPAAALTMYRSSFALLSNATAGNAAETVASLTNTGMSTLIAAPASGTATGATLTFNGWTRQSNATAYFVGPNLGSAPGANVGAFVFPTNPGGATPGSTTAGTQNLAVLPYAYGNAVPTTTTSAVTGLVRWDSATGRITMLNPATEYASNQTLATATGASGLNYRLAGAGTGGVAGLKSAVTLNGLVLDTNMASPVPPVGVSLVGSQTLAVTGPVLSTYTGTGFPTTISTFLPQQVAVAGLNFGSTTAYFHTPGDLWLRTPVSGSGGLVKSGENGSGQADLYLLATNPFTGGLTINAGRVLFTNDAQLGASGGGILMNSAGNGGLFFTQNPYYDAAPAANPTVTRPLTLGAAGGSLGTIVQNNTLTYAGPISGPGGLNVTTTGVVSLTNAANSFSGDVILRSGTAVVASDAALGASANRVVMGGIGSVGVFQPAAGYTATSRDFLMMTNSSASVVLTTGNDFTINGVIAQNQASTGAGAGLTKGGPGTLTLTAANTVGGTITVGDTAIRVSTPAAVQYGGGLRLAGANGSLPFAAGVTVNDAATFTLDNQTAVNTDRIGAVGIALGGGGLRLIGNAAANVSEQVGTVITGSTGTVTVVQPASGGAGQVTTLTLPGLSIGSGTLFVRGTNLGAASGDRAQVLVAPASLSTALPLASNIVVGGFAAASDAAAGPTDLLTATIVTAASGPNVAQYSLAPLTTYGSLSSPGAGVNANQTGGVFTLTAAASLNALRIGAGGGVNLNGQTLTLGTATANAQAGTILAAGGANAGIAGGTIDFGAQSPRIAATDNLTIGTAGSPTALLGSTTSTLFKTGPGTLTLFGTAATTVAATATSSGQVIVGEGTLALGNATALGRLTFNSTSAGPVPNMLPAVQTMNAGTLDLSALSAAPVRINNYAGAGTLALGDTTLNTASSSSPTVSGKITGSAASKFVVGVLQSDIPFNTIGNTTNLTGDNSGFAGQWVVLRGSLGFRSNLSLGTGTSPIQVGDSASFGSAGTATVVIDANLTVPFSRDILVPTGGFNLPVISSSNSGNTYLTGNLSLGKATALTGNSGGTVPGVFTLAGSISGPGQLIFGNSASSSAAGNVAITGANPNWSGGVFLTTDGSSSSIGNVLAIGADTSLGTGPIVLGQNPGLIRGDNGPRTLTNPVTVSNITPTAAFTTNFGTTGVNDVTFSGTVQGTQYQKFNTMPPAVPASPFTHTLALNAIGSGNTTFAGAVSNGASSNFGVTKNGPGLVTLAAANSYTGDTVVNAGTLRLGNPTALGFGGRQAVTAVDGRVTVNAGAVLDLNGQAGVNKGITLSGGTLSNGSGSAASLSGGTVASLTLGGTLTGFSAAPTVTLSGGGGAAAAAQASLGLSPSSFAFTPLTQGGSGYSSAPAVTISGGTGATAVATLGVTAQTFTITNGGAYSVAPTSVTISGSGTSGATTATATVITSGASPNITVTGVTITNAGTGYLFAPTITFSGGTSTTPATGVGNATNFQVGSVTLTSPGGGFTAAPGIAFSGGGGTGATVTPNATSFVLGVQQTASGTGYTSAPTVTFGSGTVTATANLSSVTLTAGTANTVSGSGAIVVNAPVSGGGSLLVAGPGTVTLTGVNTYIGGTTVQGGTALVSGQTGSNSGTGTGTVTVSSGGTFGGAGRAAGAVTVNSGGTLAPGAGNTGTLLAGAAVTLNAGSTFRVGIATATTPAVANSGGSATPGTGNTFVNAGSNAYTFATPNVLVDVTGLTFTPFATYSFQVGQGSGVVVGVGATPVPVGTFTFVNSGVDVTSQFSGGSGPSLTFDPTLNNIYLNFTPVPEPVTVLGVGVMGLVGFLRWRRAGTKSGRGPNAGTLVA